MHDAGHTSASSTPAPIPPLLPSGDPPKHRTRKRRWRRVLAWTAGGLALLLVLLLVGGYAAYRYYNGRIKHVQIVLPHPGQPRPVEAPAGTENYLLVGVDSRVGTGSEFSSQYAVEGERSDTTILAHLDKNGTTTLLSFPRDMYVTIPAYTDKNGVKHPEEKNKFNSAIDAGGPALLVALVEDLTHIRIDHYVQIDLAGFRAMSSAIGGVDVCLKKSSFKYYGTDGSVSTNLHDGFSQFNGHVGENVLKGENALAFVRQRYGLPNGDLDRIKRQQVFLGAVFRKAMSTGTLLNPDKLFPLLNAATANLELDKGSGLGDLRKLAGRLRHLDANKIYFETVDTRFPTPSDPGAYYDNQGNLQISGVGSVEFFLPTEFNNQLGPLGGHLTGMEPATGPDESPGAPPPTPAASAGAGGSTAPTGSAGTAGSPSAASPAGPSGSASASQSPPPSNAAQTGTCADPIY